MTATSTQPAAEPHALAAPRKQSQRELGAAVVSAVYRVVKLSTLHSLENQAMVRQVDETAAIIADYTAKTGKNLSILFGKGSVYVGGKLLRANRGVYEAALELGEILKRAGATELGIAGDVRPPDLNALVVVTAAALRGQRFGKVQSPRIRLRDVDESSLLSDRSKVDANAVVVRTYATAVVTMRRYFDDVRQGRYALSQRVRRSAQRLVDLSAGETAAYLGITSARNANSDDAGRAVNTAILSLAMARQLTNDRIELAHVALAALLLDTARARATGMVPSVPPGQQATQPPPLVLPHLGEGQEASMPAGTAVVLTGLGRLDEAAVTRVVLGFEANWVKWPELGPPYQGVRPPTTQARIVAIARAFSDLLTPSPGQEPVGADEAVAALEREASSIPAARTVLRLLVGALGIFPTGTLVELSTGEVALVTRTPSNPARYSMPTVRLVFDERGATLNEPIEIDLAEPVLPGDVRRSIRRVVATSDDAAASSMRSLVGTSPSWVPTGPSSSTFPAARTPSPASVAPGGLRRGSSPQTTNPRQETTQPRASVMVPPGRRDSQVAMPRVEAQPPARRDSSVSMPRVDAASTPSALPRVAPGDTHPPRRATPAPPMAARPAPTASHEHAAAAPLTTTMQPMSPHDPTGTLDPDALPAEATAQGDLGRTPLLHLLVYMLDQGLTGTLVLSPPEGGTHRVYFSEGAPAKVRTGGMIAPLDRVILELGLLDEATLMGTLLEISKNKTLHGRHLVAKGLLAREQVVGVLALQLFRKLTALFELPPETRYAYFDGKNLVSTYGGPELLPCEPLEAIMSGVRLRATDGIVDATLGRIVGQKLGVHPDVDPRRFGLSRDEAAVVDLLRARRWTLDELLAAGAAQDRIVRLTVYALAVTRYLDLGVAGRPPIGLAARSAVPVGTAAARAIARKGVPGAAADVDDGFDLDLPVGSDAHDLGPPPTLDVDGLDLDLPAELDAEGLDPAPELEPVFDEPPAPAPAPAPPRAAAAVAPAVARPAPAPAPPAAAASPAPAPSAARDLLAAVLAGPPADAVKVPARAVPAPQPAPAAPRVATPEPPVAAAPPKPVAAPPVAAPAALDAAKPAESAPAGGRRGGVNLDERRAELDARLKLIDKQNFFEILGIARDAAPDAVQAAYFQLAKTWHPDRQPQELAFLKPQIARLFARINEAFQALSDAAKRAEHTKSVDDGGGTAEDKEKVSRVVEAAMEFQKADFLMKKGDLVAAEALATRAVQADSAQPEYVTVLAWIQYLRRAPPAGWEEGQPSTHWDDLLKVFDAVLAREPRYERGLYYRGQVLKRSGRIDKAILDFRLAAEINPRNTDALREVRLFSMRAGQTPAPSPSKPSAPSQNRPSSTGKGGATKPEEGGGLFNRLFKKS